MPQPGETIDRFVVEEQLGQGGMASVYRVRHTGLGSLHALKVLDLRFESVRKRLLLEGQVQAQLSHPNIVAVTDLVQVEGAPGLILEYVAGPSLEAWLARHRPDPATADALFRGVLDAVVHAHRHDLVHRDLKPGNVLLQELDGRLIPKVADFGLAKLLSDEPGPAKTRTGLAMGTPGYMAPEQIRDAKHVDQRADVFALGCILYELWCGGPPFHGDSVFDVLVAIEDRNFVAPRELRPDLPNRVEKAILACLEPEPAKRLPTAEALRRLLDEPEEASSAPPPTSPPAQTQRPEAPAKAPPLLTPNRPSDPLPSPTFEPPVAPVKPALRAAAPIGVGTTVSIILFLVVLTSILLTLTTFTLMFLAAILGAINPQ